MPTGPKRFGIAYLTSHGFDRSQTYAIILVSNLLSVDAPVDVPELTSAMPLFDGIVNALNSFASTVEAGVNDALAIKNAFLISGDFMGMALWGLAATVCVAIPAALMSRSLERARMRQIDELAVRQSNIEAELAAMRVQLELVSSSR